MVSRTIGLMPALQVFKNVSILRAKTQRHDTVSLHLEKIKAY